MPHHAAITRHRLLSIDVPPSLSLERYCGACMRTSRTLFHYFFVLRERTREAFAKRSPRLPFLIISTLVPRTILFTVLPLVRNERGGSYSSPMIRPSNQPLPNTSMTHVLRYGIERHRP